MKTKKISFDSHFFSLNQITLPFILLLLLLTKISIIDLLASNSDEFIIGKDNSNKAIYNLKELTGLSLEEIEHRARPCAYTDWIHCSMAGFIGIDDSFIDVLIKDNDIVHEYNLTHQEVSKPLFALRKLSGIHKFNNLLFKVKIISFFGWQESIFNDEIKSSKIVELTRMDTNEVLKYDENLLPNYIKLYGFYEGDTTYRVSPKKIISFFNLDKLYISK